MVKIDADAHRTVGERYEIAGFPMLKFFKKGDEKVATTKELAVCVAWC